MSLAEFIRRKTDLIVDESERFARTVVSLTAERDISVLRNHLPLVLQAVALDLEQPQTRLEQSRKSEGLGPTLPGETAAQVHGRLRADSGLSIEEVVAEYRVLRAAVLRLWDDEGGLAEPGATADLMRFNEAIDQAIAESVIVYSEKMDRWRQTLLAVIGHELRTPLQSLKLATHALQRRKDASIEKLTTRLASGIDNIGRLLDALLDYNRSKLGAGMQLVRTRVALADDCAAEVEQLRAALPRIAIDFETRGDTTGEFDALRVRETLSNLVSNAHQYKMPDTNISVQVHGHATDVVLIVSNEGPEISPAGLGKLFEPFQRNGQSGFKRNLGLGLFVVREIARAHGGEVKAESGKGRVSFEVRLPKRGVDA